MLKQEETVLILIDIQGKLAEIVDESEFVIGNIEKAVQGAKLLNIPILWLEQYPKGLGRTVAQLSKHLEGVEVIEKITFSAYDNVHFKQKLQALNRKQLLIAGIETHICVYQTAAQLLEANYEVQVIADAVSSRTIGNREVGIQKMMQLGAKITSVEMALFELQQIAQGETFKAISKLVK
jgi:nicotinamidase-related amidase